MVRVFFALGALLAFFGVAAGAFGAHGLEGYFDKKYEAPRAQRIKQTWETGVRYQIYHALALLAVAWACTKWPGTATVAAGWLFTGGTVIFSGSLYLLCVTGVKALGAVTPLGGTALLIGWLCLAWAAWKGPA